MAKDNKKITLKGNPVEILGPALEVGQTLPAFTLTGGDLGDLKSSQFAGKKLVIISIPSVDTPVCAIETKKFNQEASKLANDVVILAVSRDLPFAQKRWCAAEGVDKVVTASDYKYRTFGQTFGVDAAGVGLLARAVFVSDSAGKLIYVDYVSEIADEPNYAEVLAALK